MVILAASPPEKPMQIQELSELGGIPAKFLEQILLVLRRGGLLRSKRGVGGGYQLGKAAREISIGEIVALVDGGLCALAAHAAADDQEFTGARGLRDALSEIDALVNARLNAVTLDDIVLRDSPDAMLAFGI